MLDKAVKKSETYDVWNAEDEESATFEKIIPNKQDQELIRSAVVKGKVKVSLGTPLQPHCTRSNDLAIATDNKEAGGADKSLGCGRTAPRNLI